MLHKTERTQCATVVCCVVTICDEHKGQDLHKLFGNYCLLVTTMKII